jgi:hypothetical protein
MPEPQVGEVALGRGVLTQHAEHRSGRAAGRAVGVVTRPDQADVQARVGRRHGDRHADDAGAHDDDIVPPGDFHAVSPNSRERPYTMKGGTGSSDPAATMA